MKKSITLIMALAMILGMSQCKKRIETVTPNIVTDEGVFVSITIDRGDKHVVHSDGTVEFETGDVLYVGNDGKYCGTLTYSGNDQFSGTITPTSTDDYLHFYFVGGFAPKTTPEAGTTTSLTVNISDQSGNLPVLSYGQSTEKYTSGLSSYTSFLLNKCGLVKFNLTNTDIPAATKVAILGMNNEATIHFDGEPFTYSKKGNGQVILKAIDDQNRWAILPVQAAVTDAVAKVYGYANSTTFGVPAVTANMYYTTGVSIPGMELMLDKPLTFEAKTTAGATVVLNMTSVVSMDYSTDGSTWEEYDGREINLDSAGDKVQFRATSTGNNGMAFCSFAISNGDCYVYGNVMSLLYQDFGGKTQFPSGSTNTFYRLFENCQRLTSDPNKPIILPATELVSNCYLHMFIGCTNLTTAPELPAETLAEYCYQGMFSDCTSLESAPELPATTLAVSCYQSMFSGCTNLTTAPELPATTLDESCYGAMFRGCTSLTAAPELLATTLTLNCYDFMFQGCTNLSAVTCLAINTDFPENPDPWECCVNWLEGVASTGTFTKAAGVEWPEDEFGWGIPVGWDVVER